MLGLDYANSDSEDESVALPASAARSPAPGASAKDLTPSVAPGRPTPRPPAAIALSAKPSPKSLPPDIVRRPPPSKPAPAAPKRPASPSPPALPTNDVPSPLDASDEAWARPSEQDELRAAMRPPPLGGKTSWPVPPPPPGPVDPDIEGKVKKFHELKRQSVHFNDKLMSSHAFRNPHIGSKLVEWVDIDETATNFSASVWDPHAFGPHYYASAIADLQKQRSEERNAAQAAGKRSAISFTSSASSSREPLPRAAQQERVRESLARRDSASDRGHDRQGGVSERDRGRGGDDRQRKRSRWDSDARR